MEKMIIKTYHSNATVRYGERVKDYRYNGDELCVYSRDYFDSYELAAKEAEQDIREELRNDFPDAPDDDIERTALTLDIQRDAVINAMWA